MPILDEKNLLEILRKTKKVILLEPNYRRKYIPLGLAKISTYVKNHGGKSIYQREFRPCNEDLICLTSLFTYNSKNVLEEISKIYSSYYFTQNESQIIVGGIYASLMHQDILKRFPKAKVFLGYSKTLDMTPTDYTIDWQVKPPWNEFSHVFTTRGCPNSCAYCAVRKLEPDLWINPQWKKSVDLSKPNIMISDNNLSAQPYDHIKEIVEFIVKHKKRVVFDNGFDCKHIEPKIVKLLAQLKFTRCGMRLAFDRIEEDGIFQKAVKMLLAAGIPKGQIMAYILFNFCDTPKEAIYRAQECIKLGIRPYPQKYTPLNKKDKNESFVGKHWTVNLARAFRHFFLMAGYYTKYDFLEWIQSEKWQKKFKISKKDVELCLEE